MLHDAIFSFKIPAAWQNQPLFLALAIVVTIASQVAYVLVARSDGRPVRPLMTLFFIVVNGIVEAFIFLAAYQLFIRPFETRFWQPEHSQCRFRYLGIFSLYSGFCHAFFFG